MSNKDKARSFVFYESYMSSVEELEDESTQLEVLKLIIHYGIEGIIIDNVSKLSKSIFRAHQFNIDESLKRRKTAIENGKKGGAPVGNENAKKDEINQNQPKTTKEDYNVIKNNLNVNVNDNVNDNAKVNANVNAKVNENVNFNVKVNEDGIVKGREINQNLLNDRKALQKIANKTYQDNNQVYEQLNYLINNQFIVDNETGETIKTIDDYIEYKKKMNLIIG